jgi:hypothetical protein
MLPITGSGYNEGNYSEYSGGSWGHSVSCYLTLFKSLDGLQWGGVHGT